MNEARCPCCGGPIDPLAITIDRDRQTIAHRGTWVRLTRLEFRTFRALYDCHPAVMPRERIWHLLYGDRIDGGPDPDLINVVICKLRSKLARLGIGVQTHWGIGYSITLASPDVAEAVSPKRPRRSAESSEDEARVVDLHERGFALVEIARQSGLTYREVTRILAQCGRLRSSQSGVAA